MIRVRTIFRLSKKADNKRPQFLYSPAFTSCKSKCRTFGHSAFQLQQAENKGPKLTADAYPNVKRDSRYNTITPADIEVFKKIVADPATGVIESYTNPDAQHDIEPFNTDWMNKYRGQSKLLLRPRSTEEVSKILKHCSERNLAVVPQGGNTGLVGGGVPVFDEIIVNLSLMNTIRSFDAVSGTLVCDAGCVLEMADQWLEKHGYLFPLDLGAKGSCMVGGNVATNAGGLRLLRYGSLHGNVLGLEVVLPDGTILENLKTLRKDNTGYDLKQLFIGSEGTLGIITGVSILCPQRPKARNVAMLGLGTYNDVQKAFREAKIHLSEILSAFEFMDKSAHDFTVHHSGNKAPLDEPHEFYCVVETSGSNKEHDDIKLQEYLEAVMEKGLIEDGILAQDETQANKIWALREGVPESLSKLGGTYKYDVSIPLDSFYDIVIDVGNKLTKEGLIDPEDTNVPGIAVVGYGHIGDGNLHLNVAVRRYSKDLENALEPYVFEWISKHNGSISAEHGLGFSKRAFVHFSQNETSLDLMRKIKDLIDPKKILNPYKYIEK